MANKRVERAYLEMARVPYTPFPSGDISESEAPDFIVSSPDGLLGIEVTQLFQLPSASSFTPRQIESFRKSVIRRAEEIYSKAGRLPVEVNAYFSVRPPERQDKKQFAYSIAEFVRTYYPQGENVLLFQEGDLQATPLALAVPYWVGCGPGSLAVWAKPSCLPKSLSPRPFQRKTRGYRAIAVA